MGELIFLLILIAGSLFLLWQTGSFPSSAMDNSGGAALFPRVVLGLLILLLVLRIIQILCSKEKEPFIFERLFKGSPGIFLLSIFLYILLFSVLGYILATFLYAVAAITYCYKKKYGNFGTVKSILVRIAVSAAGTLLLYWFFSDILVVRMPMGPFAG